MRPRQGPAGTAGLTLFELLLAMAVAAALVSAGVPALRHLVLEARMTAAVNAMVHDLHLARQMADVQARTVLVCPADALGCRRDGDWRGGWVVAVADDIESRGATDVLAQRALPRGVSLSSNRGRFAFRPYSRRDTNGTIGFCDQRGAVAARALVVSPTGRPRLAAGADSRININCNS